MCLTMHVKFIVDPAYMKRSGPPMISVSGSAREISSLADYGYTFSSNRVPRGRALSGKYWVKGAGALLFRYLQLKAQCGTATVIGTCVANPTRRNNLLVLSLNNKKRLNIISVQKYYVLAAPSIICY